MAQQASIGRGCVLIGLVMIAGILVSSAGTYLAVQSHETTTADIRSTGVESDEEFIDTEYYPRVTYEYTVDGTTYNGTRVFHPSQIENESGELAGKEFDDYTEAETIVENYDEGATATVYYDPAEPAFAYLQHPIRDTLLPTAIVGLAGAVTIAVGLYELYGPI